MLLSPWIATAVAFEAFELTDAVLEDRESGGGAIFAFDNCETAGCIDDIEVELNDLDGPLQSLCRTAVAFDNVEQREALLDAREMVSGTVATLDAREKECIDERLGALDTDEPIEPVLYVFERLGAVDLRGRAGFDLVPLFAVDMLT